MELTISKAVPTIAEYLKADIPAFLWGAPGVGKSDCVRQIAGALKWPVVDFRAVLRDPVDLRGLPTVDMEARKAVWLPPAELPDAVRHGERGILFMDELNAAPAQMQAACFGLVLDRQVGEYKLPKGWRILAAGNRQSDKAAAQRMPSALANRFAHIDIVPDVESWCAYANARGLNPVLPAFMRFRPELLHDMRGELRAFPSPRQWDKVSRVLGAPDHLRFGLVCGLVGEGPAGELEGFLRVWRSLPPVPEIIANPTTAVVPTDPATEYAVAGALARAAAAENFAAICQYAGRMRRELGIVLVTDAVRRNPKLKETQAYVSWALANQDIQL